MLASVPAMVHSAQTLDVEPPLREIVFINTAVDNYRTLSANVRSGVEVVPLKANRNGVEKVTQVLKTCKNVTTIHLITHGSLSRIQLGSAVLSPSTLERHVWDLATWADVLATDAELLIYGCEIAEEEEQGFIFQLSQLIESKIAAFQSKTGSALGNDWELIVRTGKIKASCVFTSGKKATE